MTPRKRQRRIVTYVTEEHYQLLRQLARDTSKTMAEVTREAILKHLAELSYLTKSEKKALGITKTRQEG